MKKGSLSRFWRLQGLPIIRSTTPPFDCSR
jgi:hypothetical protein